MNACTRLCAASVIAAWAIASAQTLVEPERLAAARTAFDSAPHAARLRCAIEPSRPALSYNLQFLTGYLIDVPMSQPGGAGHRLDVLIRVTPEGRDSVFLGTHGSVPQVSASKTSAEVPGSFVVGEGNYTVDAVVRDEASRACLTQWRIQAKFTGNERDLKPAALAGTVHELGWLAPSASADRAIERLTIFVHATPMIPGAAKIDEKTIGVLSDSLSAILVQLPAKSVRLVLFNLDKQAVLFDRANFTTRDLQEVAQALERVEPGVVDYKTLQNRTRTDVLGDLVANELKSSTRSSAVILMGPRSGARADNSAPIEPPPAGSPPWYYLEFQAAESLRPQAAYTSTIEGGRRGTNLQGVPPPVNPPQVPPDGIERLVHRLNGTAFTVITPHHLAEAIHRMATEIRTVNGSGAPSVPSPPPKPTTPLTAATAEDPEPAAAADDEDPVEILAHLRDRVWEHARGVPNHMCVESVQRDRYEPLAGKSVRSCDRVLDARSQGNGRLRLDLTDWLRLDVGMADGREIFSWTGAAKFEEGEIDELIPEGAFGTGPFATMLISIFENRNARFVFDGETTLQNQRVLQYSFHVPREESGYRVKAGKEWIVTGFAGTLIVDPRTADLVRFIVRTDILPPATNTCEVDSTLDYNMVELSGFEYMLPKSTRQRFIGVDGTEGENTLTFAGCREFLGESTLTFGGRPGAAETPHGTPPRLLPEGLGLAIELTTHLTLSNAAAGDRIEGRLAETLWDAGKKNILAPAGAIARGRLTRVELQHSGSGEYTVALRWETLEIDGERTLLQLKPNRQLAGLKAAARGILLRRGTEFELPPPDGERDAVYHYPGKATQIETGLRTLWVTTIGR